MPKVTRNANIAHSRRVWTATPRLRVVVRLRIRISDGANVIDHGCNCGTIATPNVDMVQEVKVQTANFSAENNKGVINPSIESALTTELGVVAGRPVEVRIDAPGFDLLGEPRRKMAVPEDREGPSVVFDLRPRELGRCCVRLDFLQGRRLLGSTSLPLECDTREVPPAMAAHGTRVLRWDPDAPPADLLLHIRWRRPPLSQPRLEFQLWEEGRRHRFAPVYLEESPARHAREYYRQLTGVTRRLEPAAKVLPGRCRRAMRDRDTEPAWIRKAGVDRRVRALGHGLWSELIPEGLKRHYGEHREHWRDRTMLVVSDEPYLPWELVWPYSSGSGEWEDEVPWCVSLRMTRWLRNGPREEANSAPPGRLRMSQVAVVVPVDNDLITASRERDYLRALIADNGLGDAGPAQATWEAVMRLFDEGGYDWFHAAGHGRFNPVAPEDTAALWLQGREVLTPKHLHGRRLEAHLRVRRPGFVLNACETGRLARGLATQQAGWAMRLIGAGAGLFIGPQWEITDEGALRFVKCLYEELLRGETVAAAARRARLAARREGDPTWLAYCVYAHPNARLERVSG